MAEKWPRDRWLDAIWEDPTLKPTERAVAYVYARFAGDGETSWSSYPEVMRRTGLKGRTSVSNALKYLVKHGWLEEVDRARQHRSAVYRLTCPLGQSAFPTVQQSRIQTAEQSRIRTPDDMAPSSAVHISTPSSPDFAIQQSTFRDPRTQIDNSEENSDALEAERDPSGARLSPNHPYDEGGFRLCKCGLPKHRHKAKHEPYFNPPASGAYESWTAAQNITEGAT